MLLSKSALSMAALVYGAIAEEAPVDAAPVEAAEAAEAAAPAEATEAVEKTEAAEPTEKTETEGGEVSEGDEDDDDPLLQSEPEQEDLNLDPSNLEKLMDSPALDDEMKKKLKELMGNLNPHGAPAVSGPPKKILNHCVRLTAAYERTQSKPALEAIVAAESASDVASQRFSQLVATCMDTMHGSELSYSLNNLPSAVIESFDGVASEEREKKVQEWEGALFERVRETAEIRLKQLLKRDAQVQKAVGPGSSPTAVLVASICLVGFFILIGFAILKMNALQAEAKGPLVSSKREKKEFKKEMRAKKE